MTSGDSVVVSRSLFQERNGSPILTSPHDLKLNFISMKEAKECFRLWHYFGEKGFMSSYNFGVFFNDELLGCISYGVPNAIEMKGLYSRTDQKGWWEIKRMALSPRCPKNSASRVIAISIKILRKLENLKGIITYADTAQNHTGTIYKASGFDYRGLTAQKTDLFINGKIAGKKGQYRRAEEGEIEEWRPRSRKHLFVKLF